MGNEMKNSEIMLLLTYYDVSSVYQTSYKVYLRNIALSSPYLLFHYPMILPSIIFLSHITVYLKKRITKEA